MTSKQNYKPQQNYSTDRKSQLPTSDDVIRSSRAATEISKGALDVAASQQRPPTTVTTAMRKVTASNRVTSTELARHKAAMTKELYRKPIIVMAVGGVLFTVGVVMAVLYFMGNEKVKTVGPIFLSVGLLASVCGIVWIPIIQAKIKRELYGGRL